MNQWEHTCQNEPMRTHLSEWTNEDTLVRMNQWGHTCQNEPMRTWGHTCQNKPMRTHLSEWTNENTLVRMNQWGRTIENEQWEHTVHKSINMCILIQNSFAIFGDKLSTCKNLNLINSNYIYKCFDLNWLIQHLQADFELIIILLVF